ncbi:MAG: ethanolamine ammonia-lyase subunit EutC, partial [Candidatus Adiutrix sp.]|nr:ethanolamine ammonia-lyase subunit EutC [Candidatus Adiutrix sp.]
MVTEQELKKAVEAILLEMSGRRPDRPALPSGGGAPAGAAGDGDDLWPDLLAVDLQTVINVPRPHNLEALKALKKCTPARIGIWRAGPRYLTETLLRFRADHAVAMDAVFTEVGEDWLREHQLPRFRTRCDSKDVFLTRPDLGRSFEAEELKKIKAHVGGNNRVVVFVADGLSTTAVTVNALDTYKAIADGLARHNIKTAPPFFVQYGRVGAEDAIAEAVGAEVVCALIGERPGLITAESLSAYVAYKAVVDMPEARRTVVSNIHRR